MGIGKRDFSQTNYSALTRASGISYSRFNVQISLTHLLEVLNV